MKSVLVTGANGMVGRAVVKELVKYNYYTCIPVDLPDIDLCKTEDVWHMYKNYRPNYVIHLAAKVGGVKGNMDYLADFYTENIMMNANVLHGAHLYGVEKVVSLLSTCVYPDKVNYPLTEDQIHNGPPHPSNYAYAYAKRMLDVQSQAYRDQFGTNFVTAIPNNLYGNFDNFDLNNSHVIPAMIRKIYEAKMNNTNVELWGDGSPLREFTHVSDLANILLFILDMYNEREPINVGNTEEHSIKEIAEMIAEFLDFDGIINWNTSMPAGQFRKPSSNQKFKGFIADHHLKFNYMPLEKGLKETCEWFVKNYPNVRGVK